MRMFMTEYTEAALGNMHYAEPIKAAFKVDGSAQDVITYMKENNFIDVASAMCIAEEWTANYPAYIFVTHYNVCAEHGITHSTNLGRNNPQFYMNAPPEVTLKVRGYPVKNVVEALAKGYFKKDHDKAMEELK